MIETTINEVGAKLVPPPPGYLPVILGARCPRDGRYLAVSIAWLGPGILGGWNIGPTVAKVTGTCRHHGAGEAVDFDVWWGDE